MLLALGKGTLVVASDVSFSACFYNIAIYMQYNSLFIYMLPNMGMPIQDIFNADWVLVYNVFMHIHTGADTHAYRFMYGSPYLTGGV